MKTNRFYVKLKRILQALGPEDPSPFCSAIITAAGSGRRMGGVSKQLLPLCGESVFLYSLKAFHECSLVREIILSVKEEEAAIFQEIVAEKHFTKPVRIVKGGATRQQSVANAFYAVDGKSRYVAVHDAARPLIRASDITKLYREAIRFGGATAASPVADSMKRADARGMIASDVDRELLWSVQTPQVFSCDIYRVALATAQKDGFTVTDDNSLVTHAGFPVKLVDLHSPNLKLTTKDDIPLAENIIKARTKQ